MFSRIMWSIHHCLRFTKPLRGAYPSPGLPKARAYGTVVENIRPKENRYFLDDFVCNHYGSFAQARYIYVTLSLQFRTRIMIVIGGEKALPWIGIFRYS